jgi:hypothetical protein
MTRTDETDRGPPYPIEPSPNPHSPVSALSHVDIEGDDESMRHLMDRMDEMDGMDPPDC